MSGEKTTPVLDHIIILVPYAELSNIPSWIQGEFYLAPGGRHGDNKTENRLIIFKDGSYLEIIAFIDDNPAHKEGHWWGDKGFGIIDYAFTILEGPEKMSELRKRLQQEEDIPETWIPREIKSGGRTKPDGDRIEWHVAFPDPSVRGMAPFWVFDVTPRERRVPNNNEEYTKHPNGATGVLELGIYMEGAAGSQLEAFLKAVPVPQLSSPTPKSDSSFNLTPFAQAPGIVETILSVRQSSLKPVAPHLDGKRRIVADLRLASTTTESTAGREPDSISKDIDIRLTRVQSG